MMRNPIKIPKIKRRFIYYDDSMTGVDERELYGVVLTKDEYWNLMEALTDMHEFIKGHKCK